MNDVVDLWLSRGHEWRGFRPQPPLLSFDILGPHLSIESQSQ